MPATEDDVLAVDTTDRVRTLTLNRPKSRNPFGRTKYYGIRRFN